MRNKLKIRTGDLVKVVSGNQKGFQGKVLKVFSIKNKVIVEGVNVVKKHNKPNANNPKGGITEKELPIHVSNISLVTSIEPITDCSASILLGNSLNLSLTILKLLSMI